MTAVVMGTAEVSAVARVENCALTCDDAEVACTNKGLFRTRWTIRLKLSSKLAASNLPSGVFE